VEKYIYVNKYNRYKCFKLATVFGANTENHGELPALVGAMTYEAIILLDKGGPH